MDTRSSRYVFPDSVPLSPAQALLSTRIRVRCEPALLPGPLSTARDGFGALRGFAREVAARLNEARASKRGRICFLQEQRR